MATDDFTEERHLAVSRGGLQTLDEALAWVVQTYDREFNGRDWVSIEISPVWTLADNPDGGYHRWTAAVRGQVASEPVGPRPA